MRHWRRSTRYIRMATMRIRLLENRNSPTLLTINIHHEFSFSVWSNGIWSRPIQSENHRMINWWQDNPHRRPIKQLNLSNSEQQRRENGPAESFRCFRRIKWKKKWWKHESPPVAPRSSYGVPNWKTSNEAHDVRGTRMPWQITTRTKHYNDVLIVSYRIWCGNSWHTPSQHNATPQQIETNCFASD